MKIGQVQVGSNIVKLNRIIIYSNLVLSTVIWPQNTIFVHTYLYLPLLTYIWLYFGLITLIQEYLPLIALILPYIYHIYICAIFTLHMYSSIETAPLCKLLEQSDHYSWRYYISKNWGIQKCRHEHSLGVNLVIDIFYAVSDTSPLYKIGKQSDHYLSCLWRYCILKIWGIQVLFACERSSSSAQRVSNFNSNIPQGGIYPRIQFERDPLNTFGALTSSGSTGGRGGGCGGDAKTIISPNTSFGDIITRDISPL